MTEQRLNNDERRLLLATDSLDLVDVIFIFKKLHPPDKTLHRISEYSFHYRPSSFASHRRYSIHSKEKNAMKIILWFIDSRGAQHSISMIS